MHSVGASIPLSWRRQIPLSYFTIFSHFLVLSPSMKTWFLTSDGTLTTYPPPQIKPPNILRLRPGVHPSDPQATRMLPCVIRDRSERDCIPRGWPSPSGSSWWIMVMHAYRKKGKCISVFLKKSRLLAEQDKRRMIIATGLYYRNRAISSDNGLCIVQRKRLVSIAILN